MSSCCSIPSSDKTLAICTVCGQKGKAVQRITLEHLLFENRASQLVNVDYFFCPTPTCDVVYFSNASCQYFHKKHVRVRVGIKETSDPIPICYCFDFTHEIIFDEIRTTGKSTVAAYVTSKVKAGECACEIKNPSGRCCLGEVNKTIKEEMILYSRKEEPK
jgi:hypothetical protein